MTDDKIAPFSLDEIQVLTRASTNFVYFVNNVFALSSRHFIKGEHIDNTARLLSQNKKTMRVSARNHFKSYAFYAHIMWKMMFELQQKNIESHYFSFSQDLAGYHISKVKLAISSNPYFRHLRDRKPTAESVIKYTWDDKTYYSLDPHGLIQFKRGVHADYIYVDDPFQDPENQLNPTIIKKINEIFKSNILDMPNEPDGELHCAGCLDPDTDILLANGNFKKLKEITTQDRIIGYDFKQQKFIPQNVVACVDNGVQHTKRLRTGHKRDLQNIIATTNHPFFTREGWKEVSHLKVGDYIAVPAIIETEKDSMKAVVTPDEAEMLGYITAEGSIGDVGGFSFCNQDPVLINRMKTLCEKLGYEFVFRKNDENREVDMGIKLGKGKLRHDIKKRLNLRHETARYKTIPDSIFNSSYEAIAAFLKGLYDGDGVCPNIDRQGVGITISSEKLAWGMHYLLLQLGLHSTMSVAHKLGYTGKPVSMFGASLQCSQLTRRFLELTHAFEHRFNPTFIHSLKKNRGDLIPLLNSEKKLAKTECGWHATNPHATRETLRKSEKFKYLTENNIEWIKITAIEDMGERPTLNLTTEFKNFIANGFLTHNTPQTDEDFYFDKDITRRFAVKILPAITDEGKALWPEWMDIPELEMKRIERSDRIFKREYLCTPVYSTEGFFTREYLMKKVVNFDLVSQKARLKYPKQGEIIAGFDIGKKAHPSHLVILEHRPNNKLVMLHQKWMDGWSYSNGKDFYDFAPTQLEYLKMVIRNFGIDRLYYDNTRGEFESFDEQGLLPRQMIPIVFHQKLKSTMATAFDKVVERGQLEIINDDRLITQICAVTNSLEAIQSSKGHGDAFWSICLALLGIKELSNYQEEGTQTNRRKITAGVKSIFSEDVAIPAGF